MAHQQTALLHAAIDRDNINNNRTYTNPRLKSAGPSNDSLRLEL
jgi:hypothetical protein